VFHDDIRLLGYGKYEVRLAMTFIQTTRAIVKYQVNRSSFQVERLQSVGKG